MLPEKPATEPRRKWHLLRWTFVVFAVAFGWGGWKHYDFEQAVKEDTWSGSERRLFIDTGTVSERDFDLVRRLKPKDLHINATFPLRDLSQLKGLSNLTTLWLFDCPNLTNIDALKDMKKLTSLGVAKCPGLSNIDALKELKNLTGLVLSSCTALTNVDALQELKALKGLNLYGCASLKNVDGLLGLTGLDNLYLEGCTGLTKEAVYAVKAALPKTHVASDYE